MDLCYIYILVCFSVKFFKFYVKFVFLFFFKDTLNCFICFYCRLTSPDGFTLYRYIHLYRKLPEGSSKRNRLNLNDHPPYTEIFSKRRKIYSVCVEGLSWRVSNVLSCICIAWQIEVLSNPADLRLIVALCQPTSDTKLKEFASRCEVGLLMPYIAPRPL